MRCVGQVILSSIRPGGGTVSAAEVPILQQMVEIILLTFILQEKSWALLAYRRGSELYFLL